mmetsp:Transcript_22401/g.25955  ORF Transcript_22401/g.25955 Transcript_22401/m.25955 type:complete len:363 (-) Transcript_22401:35-1123(-)
MYLSFSNKKMFTLLTISFLISLPRHVFGRDRGSLSTANSFGGKMMDRHVHFLEDNSTLVSNEEVIYSITVLPFHIILDPTPDPLDIPSSVLENVMKEITETELRKVDQPKFTTLINATFVGTSSTWISSRRMQRNGRFLADDSSTSPKTRIDVGGGSVYFYTDIAYDEPSEEYLNEEVHDLMEHHLLAYFQSTNKVGSDAAIEVSETVLTTGSPSETALITESPSEEPEDQTSDSVETLYKPNEPSNDSKAAPVAMGVLGGLGLIIAAVFVAKKKTGYSFTRFRSTKGRNDDDDMASERSIKRDFDYESYMIECCTDNDEFVSNVNDSNNVFCLDQTSAKNIGKDNIQMDDSYVIEVCTDGV